MFRRTNMIILFWLLSLFVRQVAVGFLDEDCGDGWVFEERTGRHFVACEDHQCYINQASSLKIGRFTVNRNGRLKWATIEETGESGFTRSHGGCGPSSDWRGYLICLCWNDAGERILTGIDLNEQIHNYYGYLWWSGVIDTKRPHNWPCRGADWRPDGWPSLGEPLPTKKDGSSVDTRPHYVPSAPTSVFKIQVPINGPELVASVDWAELVVNFSSKDNTMVGNP